MNIIFKTLEINDFQSIGHAKIELDNQGTCLIKGINNYEDNTSSNGSGKSSIFESLYFSLYGKTTSGLTNVSNRYTGNTYKLDLTFSIDNIDYEIVREGTKVKLLQNGEDISRRNKTDTENYIKENILKLSPDIFLNIIYLSQGFKSRLSALTAGGRKDQIEEIIGTNEITENFRIEVQNYKEKLTNNLNETNNKISFNNGTINQINLNIENYQKEIDRIIEENKDKPSKEQLLNNLNLIKTELSVEENNLLKINNEMNEIKEFNNSVQLKVANVDTEISNKNNEILSKVTEINTEIYDKSLEIERNINNNITELNKSISENSNNISILCTQNTSLTNSIEQNKNQIEKLKTSDTCPTCGRKFDNFDQTHLIQEIQKLIDANIENGNKVETNNIKIKELENANLELNNKVKDLKDNIINSKSEAVKPLQDEIQDLSRELAEYISGKQKEKDKILEEIKDLSIQTNMYNEVQQKINSHKSNIIILENQINSIKEESTENYEKLISDCNSNLVKIIKENENLQKECNNLEEQIGVATHSLSLISKEFKNYLLKSAIEFLNSKLNYYSNMLFSNESDKINFVQDGNKLDIYLGDALFESLSGGEKRKVDIAIMLAQKDLANNMSNTYSNVLILDEITDGLDTKSIDIITSILMDVSRDISSMYIVTHKDTSMGHDKILWVVKGKDRISSISEE